MSLREDMEKQGTFLFRWRSYLPLSLLPLFIAALQNSELLERIFGDSVDAVWKIFCLTLSFSGLALRFWIAGHVASGTSGRSTKRQIADTLNITGMYSVVRHPIYLANFIMMVGLFLFVEVWWLVLMGIALFWLFYERIMFAEEKFLSEKFGASFSKWAQGTPAFFPNFKNWKSPARPFSWKTALRREYSTFFAVVVSFTALDIAADLLAEGKVEIELPWVLFFAAGLMTYLVLRMIKKKTALLQERQPAIK